MNIKGMGNSPVNEYRNQSARTEQTGNAASKPAERAKDAGDAATVQLSPQAMRIRELEKSLADQPEVDEARVERVRSQLASGEYAVDSDRVAGKLLEIEGSL